MGTFRWSLRAGVLWACCSLTGCDGGQASVVLRTDDAKVLATGATVYQTHCAACHDNPDTSKAPSLDTLARMSSGQISNALITGKMIAQAAPLSSAQVSYVSDFLSKSV